MYLEYLNERYDERDFGTPLEKVAERFEEIQHEAHQATILKNEKSFITYRLEGDALIIFDMYVKPQVREETKKESWRLWCAIRDLAEEKGKRVIITFSENLGKNQHMGLRVMEYVGFKPAHITKYGTTFIRGV